MTTIPLYVTSTHCRTTKPKKTNLGTRDYLEYHGPGIILPADVDPAQIARLVAKGHVRAFDVPVTEGAPA